MTDAGVPLLQLSRRVDWRFLLPDPTLGRVTYVGTLPRDLELALRQFSHQLIEDRSEPADLVVMVNPSLEVFRTSILAAQRFYVELQRPTWLTCLKQWTLLDSCLKFAHRQGMEARAYWHYPSFEAANRLLPLSHAAPLMHVVGKGKTDRTTKLKQHGSALLLRSGVLARCVSSISIVGYRS